MTRCTISSISRKSSGRTKDVLDKLDHRHLNEVPPFTEINPLLRKPGHVHIQ